MHFLLRGGILADASKADILVKDGLVEDISSEIQPASGTKIIDVSGFVLLPSFADVHVHFREPGRPDKETIRSGSMAAAHGGYTQVCTMPNLSPVPDCPENLSVEQGLIDRDAVIEVRPYASITRSRAGRELVDMESLKGHCIAFSDDGSGIQNPEMMLQAMTKAASLDCIIAAHCEDNSLLRGGYIHDGKYCHEHGHKGICSESEWGQIARDIELCEKTSCAYHVCHISTKESVDLIRRAKARGVNISCETGPHYLTLCDEDLQEDGRFKMNPPLRGADDRQALIEGLQDGTIDMIATDHAPHTTKEKARGLQGSAMGIVGLETSFPVLYTKLVKSGILSLEKLSDLMSGAPRRRFGLSGGLQLGQSAEITAFDLNVKYKIDSGTFLSMGHSTPFEGMEVYGKCMLTLHKGEIVWQA